MKKIIIYTDGSSIGNPGPGGYASIIIDGEKERVLSGGQPHTTNNRMEMIAMVKALEWIKKNEPKAKVDLYSDSALIIRSINDGWKRKQNLDIWMELEEMKEGLEVNFQWIKGHAGNTYNERCDQIAVQEAEKWKRKAPREKGKDTAYFQCQHCKKRVDGLLGLMPDSGMIRTDCDECGKFIMFAPKTKENRARAKKRQLINKSELQKVLALKKKKGEEVSKNDLAKIKTWTADETQEFLESDQTLF